MRYLTIIFVSLVIASLAWLCIDCILGVRGTSMAKVVAKVYVPERNYNTYCIDHNGQPYIISNHEPEQYLEIMFDGKSTFKIPIRQTIFYLDTIGQIKTYRYRKGKWTHYKYLKTFIR